MIKNKKKQSLKGVVKRDHNNLYYNDSFKDVDCIFEINDIEKLKKTLKDFRLIKMFISVKNLNNEIQEYEHVFYNNYIIFKDVFIEDSNERKDRIYNFTFYDKINNVNMYQSFNHFDVLIFQDFKDIVEESRLNLF